MSAVETAKNPLAAVRNELNQMQGQFAAALPAHIPAERFSRVVMTAIQGNLDLLACDRRSLWNAAMKAASDGLLPDGREGAMVIYKSKVKDGGGGERWIEMAQWLPMIAGIRKKVRNSGDLATWEVHVVYDKDEFDYQLGDEPFIKHRPLLGVNRGTPIAAYSIATLKSGEKSREVMSIAEIEAIRARSRAGKSGPWVTDYAEMCRKTVARRHAKVLPMSTDLDDLIRRDDELYQFDEAKKAAPKSVARNTLDAFAGTPAAEAFLNHSAPDTPSQRQAAPAHNPETGELPVEEEEPPEFDAFAAFTQGQKDFSSGKSIYSVPQAYTEEFKKAWKEGWENEEGAKAKSSKGEPK